MSIIDITLCQVGPTIVSPNFDGFFFMYFRWTDGWPNAEYNKWAEDEPDEDGEGCAGMNEDGEWFNGMCSAAYNYVCKTTDGKI